MIVHALKPLPSACLLSGSAELWAVLTAAAQIDDDSEVESLLHQISDSRHAGDRRDAMSQLKDILVDSAQVIEQPDMYFRNRQALHFQAMLPYPCVV